MDETKKKIPGKWLKWLENEVTTWRNEGVINEAQAGAILSRYAGLRDSDEADRGSRLVTVLAVLGALLVGVGVITFFAANWQVIPKWVKVSLVFGSIVVSYAVGYYLAFEKQNYPRVGRAIIFLGSILYGAGIWLVAQIFHINAHYPDGVLFWAIGIVPIVVVCSSLSILIEASLLLTLATILEQTGFQNSNYMYLPLMAVIIILSYRLKSRLAVGLTLPGMAVWLAINTAISFKSSEAIVYIGIVNMALGLLFYGLGCLQKTAERLAVMKTPFQIVGLLVFFLSSFIVSFKWFSYSQESFIRTFTVSPFFTTSFSIVALLAFGSSVLLLRRDRAKKESFREAVFMLIVVAAVSVVAFTGFLMGRTGFVAYTNILLFASVVTVIVMGYVNKEPVLINFGLIFFVLDVIARYFDFFWDMLDKSVFFIVGGLLLLIGGTILERRRRKIVQEMKVKNYAA